MTDKEKYEQDIAMLENKVKQFEDNITSIKNQQAEIQTLKSQAAGLELKEQLMKQVVIDLYDTVDSLKVKKDTIK